MHEQAFEREEISDLHPSLQRSLFHASKFLVLVDIDKKVMVFTFPFPNPTSDITLVISQLHKSQTPGVLSFPADSAESVSLAVVIQFSTRAFVGSSNYLLWLILRPVQKLRTNLVSKIKLDRPAQML